MDPVWDILRFDDERDAVDQVDTPRYEPEPKLVVPAAKRLMETYGDPDGSWAERLRFLARYDWATVPSEERETLGRFFVGHADPAVRDGICGALAEWNDTDHLLELAHDPLSWVRKSATYYLQLVPPSQEVARLAWGLISSGEVASTRGQEAVRTYSVHAAADEVTSNLIELARSDLRQSIRYEAISILDDKSRPVLSLLTEPPLLTWSVHTMLLVICSSNRTAVPSVAHLHDVDNLDLVEALIEYEEKSI
jgi:hypothetical protein